MAVNMGVIWASYWAQGRDVIDWGGILQITTTITITIMLNFECCWSTRLTKNGNVM